VSNRTKRARRAGRFATLFSSQPRSGFDDMNGRFELRPSSRDQIAVTPYLGNDDVDNSRELQLPSQVAERLAARGLTLGDISITDIRDFRNTGLSVRWNREWTPKVRSTLTFGRSDFDAFAERSSTVVGRAGGTGELNVVDDTTVTVDVPIAFSATQELSLGVQHTRNRVGYQFATSLAPPSGTTAAASPLTTELNRTTKGDVSSIYAQHRLALGSRVFATPGIRVTQFSETGERYLEPRLSGTVLIGGPFRAKAAWGRYHQFVNRLVREDVLQGNRQFWALADGTEVPVAASTNMAAGAAYETSRLLVDAEWFARDLADLSQLAPRVLGTANTVDLSQPTREVGRRAWSSW
jgi:outer membrane receptor for ferrienterochelin and colicin